MAEFLTTQGTSYYIEDIIRNAKNRLFLISPYLQLSRNLSDRLKDADNRKVKITLVYGKDELKPEEREELQKLKNLSLYFCENLHAKCYFNEEHMVISSMNMYAFSEKNNREMGVLIRANEDKTVFDEAVKESESILNSANKDSLVRSAFSEVLKEAKSKLYSAIENDSKTTSKTRRPIRTAVGYCIRCGATKPYDLDAPYCRDCYKVWSEWQNPDYEESYCHTCGKGWPGTMEKPQCESCYRSGR